MTWTDFLPYSGFILALIALELIYSAKLKWSNYDWKESLTSVAFKYLRWGTTLLYTAWFGPVFAWFYEHRIYTPVLPHAIEYVLTFVLAEFIYYAYHRFSHENALGWASHATHHTITKMNLTASGRVEITTPFSLYYFAPAPLFLLGVNPWILGSQIALILIYQQMVHTEVIAKNKFLDAFLMSPSNHRVHHATQPIYLNKNYGGITCLFDRLFGTYQAELESEKPIYGLVSGFKSYNPIRVGFIGWEIWARRIWKRHQQSQDKNVEPILDLKQSVG